MQRILISFCLCVLLAACAPAPVLSTPTPAFTATPTATPAATRTPEAALPKGAKRVSFALLEDYEKGDDLKDIAKDFILMNELEIDTMRTSFGWDNFEPERGQYDFAWLEEFVSLADQYGIKLRPYIGYTPEWAGAADSDGIAWNNPPGNYQDWYNFVYQLALALSDHPNVLSYEIYNEMNTKLWWDGSAEQYQETLKQAAEAIHAADPDAQILLGGLADPDYHWFREVAGDGSARYYDILPFHAYPETWSDGVAEKFLEFGKYPSLITEHNKYGEGEPVWINEMGYATTPGKTEEDQANWWARAVSTFLAKPEIEHIGVYEIKDLDPGVEAIGDDKNYYLGLTYRDGTKKLAFHTVDLLTDLLDTGTLTVADADLEVTVDEGSAKYLYYHLFKRPDGAQVLFVWDRINKSTVDIKLKTPGSSAEHYSLAGEATPFPAFDGTTLKDIQLSAGNVEIFRINP